MASFSPSEFSGETAPISDLGGAALFDIVAYDAGSAMCVWANTDNIINVGYLTQTGFLGVVPNGYPNPFLTTETATTALSLAVNSDLSQVCVLYANSTQYLRAFSLYGILSGYAWGPVTVDSSAGNITRVTTIYEPNGYGWRNYWSYDFPDNSNNYVYTNIIWTDGQLIALRPYVAHSLSPPRPMPTGRMSTWGWSIPAHYKRHISQCAMMGYSWRAT